MAEQEMMTDKQFENLIGKLNKKFENTIFMGNDREAVRDVRIKFKSPMLTYAFGGLLLGRIVHLFGKKSQGKSSLSTHIAAELQQYWTEQGHPEKAYVAYIDFERSFDIDFAESIGMDVDKVIVIRAFNIEDAFTTWEELIRTGRICCTIFDSDATAPTRNELNDEVNKANFGAGALAIGRVLKRVNVYNYHYKSCFIHISQERKPMDPMQKVGYTGGSAPEFYATYQFRISKLGNIDVNGETVGIQIRARNFKNKGCATPFRDALLDFYFKSGLHSENEYKMLFDKAGLVTNDSGHYDSEKYGIHVYGAPKYQAWLDEHPDVYKQMCDDLQNALLGKVEAMDATAIDPLSAEERAAKEGEGKAIAEAVDKEDPSVTAASLLADNNFGNDSTSSEEPPKMNL